MKTLRNGLVAGAERAPFLVLGSSVAIASSPTDVLSREQA